MRMRLIDADALLEKIKDYPYGYRGMIENDIAQIPTIEPKHGRWIWNKRLGNWYCSNCDRIMNPYTVEKSEGLYEMCQPPFCGWCGSRMDEVE